MNMVKLLIHFFGRALFSIVFIAGGLHSLSNWLEVEQELAQTILNWAAYSAGVPSLQQIIEGAIGKESLILLIGTVFQLMGGVMIFLGIAARWGAFLLLLFLLPATILFHSFWLFPSPEKEMQMIHFLLNTSLIGALLCFISGKCSKPNSEEK